MSDILVVEDNARQRSEIAEALQQAGHRDIYSGLVGTLTMARTMKDPRREREILEARKKFLVRTSVPRP